MIDSDFLNIFSQPGIRGILIACSGVAAMLGFFFVYLLGTITTWRNVALICLSLPLATMVAISFVRFLNIVYIFFF